MGKRSGAGEAGFREEGKKEEREGRREGGRERENGWIWDKVEDKR